MNLVSQFQLMNAGYLENIFEKVEWGDLSEREQKQFGRAFLDKTLTDSNASKQLEDLMSSN